MSTSGKAVRLHLKFGDVSWTSPEFELSDRADPLIDRGDHDDCPWFEVAEPKIDDLDTLVSAEVVGLGDEASGAFVLQPLRAGSGKTFTGVDGGRLYAESEGKKTYEIPMLKDGGDGCAVTLVLKWSQDSSRERKQMDWQACILVRIKPTESTKVAFEMMNEILKESGIVSHLAQRENHYSFGKLVFDSDDSFDPRGMLASWSRLGAIERFLNTVERPLGKIARSSKLGLASVACNLPLREVKQLDPVKLTSQVPRVVNLRQLPNLPIKAQKTQGTRNTCLNQAIAKSLELVSGDIQKELDQLTGEVKNEAGGQVLQFCLKRFEDLKRRCEALRSASEPWIAMRNAKDPPADRNYDVKPREGPGADVMHAIEQYRRDARSIEPGRGKGLFARVVEGLSAPFKYAPRIYEEWLFLRMMKSLEALGFRETGGKRSPFELWRDRVRAYENATRMFFKDEENLTFDLTSDPPLKLRCRICFHVKADIENPDGTVKPGGINGLNHRVVAKSYSDEKGKHVHNSPECLMIFEHSEAASGAFYGAAWDAKYGKEKKDLKKKCRTTIDKYKNNFEIDGKPLARVFTLCWLGNSSEAMSDGANIVRYDKVISPTFDSDTDRLKNLFGDIAFNADHAVKG